MKRKLVAVFVTGILGCLLIVGCAPKESVKIPVRVLILPKFEIGDMDDETFAEAQLYYNGYVRDGQVYDIPNTAGEGRLYYKDGVALFVTGMGKVKSAVNTSALLTDDRFDFSDSYILSTGCSGCAAGYGVMGDVYVITAAVDYDLGHHIDPRDMHGEEDTTWIHDSDFDSSAVVFLDEAFTDKVYDLVKDIKPETTEKTRQFLKDAFPGEPWAVRDPAVLRGTAVTGDDYWKGWYDHKNAVKIVETYKCRDPFASSDMEDVAILQVLSRFGLLERSIVLRDAVDEDVFMMGNTPEQLWGESSDTERDYKDDQEYSDIFETAMKNNYEVGKVIIDAILKGDLKK